MERFDRKVRDLARRLSRDDGLRHHERLQVRSGRCAGGRTAKACATPAVSLDPEADARFSAVFDAAVAAEQAKPDEGRTFDQLKADAFINLVTAPAAPGARRPAEINVLIDLATLQHGLHEHRVCETFDGQPLPPATVRRLACEAEIIPIVLGGDTRVVDVGRARRFATADQRRALRAMHTTCAAPDCQVRFGDCDIHHLKEWNHGGATDLANLIPLCSTPPPPHPRRPLAPTGTSTGRLSRRPAAGGPARPDHRPSPPHLQELFDNRPQHPEAASARTPKRHANP